MGNSTDHTDHFVALPKVELHRHLEGALRLETLKELAQAHQIALPDGRSLSALVQMQASDQHNFATFLSKFQTLRLFFLSEEVIRRVVREAVEDAAADNIRYMELRFTPVALSRAQGYPLGTVMDWVIESCTEACRGDHITTRLIASVNRHESVEMAAQVAELAIERMEGGIVALDLAGNEANFSALPFSPVLERARECGLRVSVHAGEWGGPENVRQALTELQANRVGHGVRVMEDPEVVRLAASSGTAFEVCITSNAQSGVVQDGAHPLPAMLAAGVNAVIASDDPCISQIRLSDEFRRAYNELKISEHALRERIVAAARASFLPEGEKQALVSQIEAELERIPGL